MGKTLCFTAFQADERWRFRTRFHREVGKTSDSTSRQDSEGSGDVWSFLDPEAPDGRAEGRRKPQPVTLISNSRCYCKASQGNPCIIFPYELEIPHQKTQMLKVQKDGTKNWGGASSQRPEATYLPTEQNQTTLQVTGWRHVKQVHRWVPLREVQFNPLEGQLCCTPEVRWAAQTHSPQQKELMASKGFMPGVVSDSTQLLKGRTYSY